MGQSLYRAIYRRADGTQRGHTFAARDAAEAQRVAEQWALSDRLLTLRLDRPLQAPMFNLEGNKA